MSTGSKLLAKTGDLQLPSSDLPPAAPPVSSPHAPPAVTRTAEAALAAPAIQPQAGGARTGPGRMLQIRSQMLANEGEVETLREKLKQYEGSAATKRLDPSTILPSNWANRHADAFKSTEFERLKEDIKAAGGNVQAIAVRPSADHPGQYEVIFGHRRHRACLELGIPVLATIISEPLTELELFAAMDRENRERADLSPYEQGLMYRKALDAGLYPSNRRLAEALGVSHTWVANVLTVADLPQAVIECFRTPIEIQHRHARQILEALEQDRKGVLRRAEKQRQSEQKLSAGETVKALCRVADRQEAGQQAIDLEGKSVGAWKLDGKGRLRIQLLVPSASQEQIERAIRQLVDAVAK
jgi:ParB family transcriptional regulator, chromosome partitioning protein